MALFKSLTFGDVNSMDYDVYITGAGVYNAPERAVEMYAIPGRNGALAIDGGRYENIEVTYTCGCFANTDAEFSEKIRAFRNAICSQYTYTRLTDEYNPDEYRMALYRSGLEMEPFMSKAGEFEITFDCKPQRFLTSGESTYQIGEWGQTITETGDIVTYQGDDLTAVKSLTTALEPIQDLHGYDNPWPAGGTKNKMPNAIPGTVTNNGITVSLDQFGVFTVTGATTDTAAVCDFPLESSFVILSGDPKPKFCIGNSETTVDVAFRFMNGTTQVDSWACTPKNRVSEYIGMQGRTCNSYRISVNANTTVNMTIAPMLVDNSVTDYSYLPYSNICPTYGRTGQTVTVTGKNFLSKPFVFYSNVSASKDDCFYLKTGTYTFSFGSTAETSWRFVLRLYDLNGNEIVTGNPVISAYMPYRESVHGFTNGVNSTAKNFTFTIESDCYVRILFCGGSTSATSTFNDSMLELGSTATAYEPYAGTTYARSFVDGQGNTLTVYGGEDEIVGGVLTADSELITFDGSNDEGWTAYTSFNGYYIPIPTMKNGTRQDGVSNMLVNSKTSASGQTNVMWLGVNSNRLFIIGVYETMGSTVADLRTFLSQNPLQVVYPLATPITHQLTPTEVTTLIGTNHVWSDAGEVTVEYGTDPYTMVNDTPFPSKPLIKVTGYGEVGFGDITITITGTAGVVTYIDCDLMECYRMSGGAIVPANQYVTFTGTDFPTIPTGKTRVTSASTISKVEVVPRWWII